MCDEKTNIDELTLEQLKVAQSISDKNTAPEEVEVVSPEKLETPDDSILEESEL